MKSLRIISTVMSLSLAITLMGCGGGDKDTSSTTSTVTSSDVKGSRSNEPEVLVPSADGVEVYNAAGTVIDASNSSEGYVMVSYSGGSNKVRLLIDTPSGNRYQFRLTNNGEYETFPLPEGSGSYTVGVYENISGDKYAAVTSQTINANMPDANRTFLYPSQYVNFNADSNAVAKAKELANSANTDLDVVVSVYDFIAQNITYDYDLADTVESGYLPVVDNTLRDKTGICFDYSSLMAAMLRSQRIPTKLEIGYAGDVYHAWISVYLAETGWVDGVIYFDGTKWSLMDPTLASYATRNTIKNQMENASEYYSIKYVY